MASRVSPERINCVWAQWNLLRGDKGDLGTGVRYKLLPGDAKSKRLKHRCAGCPLAPGGQDLSTTRLSTRAQVHSNDKHAVPTCQRAQLFFRPRALLRVAAKVVGKSAGAPLQA